ncbi:9305_t:CDS:2, partial [Acaulospora colombiana]
MVRGNSLTADLSLLVNNIQYSDLKIKCEDGILHGNRAILAARSDILDRLLYNGMKESLEEQVSFPDIKTSVMKLDNLKDFILDFYKQTCHMENNAPELLSKVVKHLSLPAENVIIDFLVKTVAKIPLDIIEFGRLSFQALQCLLFMTYSEKDILTSNEYSVLRYAILLSAKEVTPEGFSVLKKRLPEWNKIEHGFDIHYERMPDNSNIRASISNKLASLIEYIDLWRINGNVLTDIIEPLDLITQKNMTEAYRFHARRRISYSRGDIKWDKNGCGPDISISSDGRAISCNSEDYRSVRTNYLMNSGIHELCILIEGVGRDEGIGLCCEALDYSSWAGYQANGWVLSSHSGYYHDTTDGGAPNSMSLFNITGYVIFVSLDMDNRA